jgi:hypothetical protein
MTGDPSEYGIGVPDHIDVPLTLPKRPTEFEMVSDEIVAAREQLRRASERLQTLDVRLDELRRSARR